MQNNWSKCIYRWRRFLLAAACGCSVGAALSFAFSAKLILWIILNCRCHFWPMQMKFSPMKWFHFGPQFFICSKIKMEPATYQKWLKYQFLLVKMAKKEKVFTTIDNDERKSLLPATHLMLQKNCASLRFNTMPTTTKPINCWQNANKRISTGFSRQPSWSCRVQQSK